MSPTLTALAGSLLVLAWEGDPESVYTIQSSLNCQDWESLPLVISGTAEPMSYSLESESFPRFLRLRHDKDGDTNENGLPDTWEWEMFSRLDVDPNDDPDADGLSNFAEWLAQSDPLDFYNGIPPVLNNACGREWIVRRNTVSRQAIQLQICHPSGEPWAHAPVRIGLDSGRQALLQEGELAAASVNEIVAYTDEQGMISANRHAIHVLGSPHADSLETLHLLSGKNGFEIRIRTVPEGYEGPPRSLTHQRHSNGLHELAWKGNPGSCSGFIAEELSASNDWIPILELEAVQLTTLQQADGSYIATTE